jgi:DNA-binding NtrC family response regulator
MSRALARVLVVEDDPTVAEVVRRYLEREGFAVEAVGDGREALSVRTPNRLISSCSTSCCRDSTASRCAESSGPAPPYR